MLALYKGQTKIATYGLTFQKHSEVVCSFFLTLGLARATILARLRSRFWCVANFKRFHIWLSIFSKMTSHDLLPLRTVRHFLLYPMNNWKFETQKHQSNCTNQASIKLATTCIRFVSLQLCMLITRILSRKNQLLHPKNDTVVKASIY